MAIQLAGNTVIHDNQNVQVSGVTTASSFVGDGSQLTNLPASGGTLQATASGTLADGSTVIVNADGTVSVITQTTVNATAGTPVVYSSANTYSTSATYDSSNGKVVIAYRAGSSYGTAVVGTVSGTSISFGTPVVFESATTSEISATYDSTNGKVVIAYQDAGANYRGTAVVGTVSGNSISFGTPEQFENGITGEISATYDSSNGKAVIAYRDQGNSNRGTVRVGTVSGTSITFGSTVLFHSNTVNHVSATYDSSNNKVVIAYQDEGNSDYGTAVVGTVSGTSISFGSSAVFESSDCDSLAATYDSTNNKVVIAYRDDGDSDKGKAVVGTVSGTSISFGTPVVFESSNIDTWSLSATFDSTNNKVVIIYADFGNSGYGTVINGTVSGTSISFGSSLVFESASTGYGAVTYDSTNDKSVVVYRDGGNSSYGTASVITSDTLSSSLTAENFIGISNGAYSNGQTATIQISGSIDDAQSGLTPGQKYYVQGDGTLSETADDPSVFAGTAVASTKLIING